jgi:hypothetical protein
MTRHNRWAAAVMAVSLGLVAACGADNSLGVTNTDQPDVARALATPDGIDAVLRGSFSAIFDATHGASGVTAGDLTPAAMGIALESYGSVNNYSMNIRATFPRVAIDNSRGNNTAVENFRDFQTLSARSRTTSNAVAALDKLVSAGGGLGSASANARARSFGFFVIGVANAELALMYDSAAASSPALKSTDIPPLQDYNAAMTTALTQLDTAINIATAAQAAGASFTIPDTYMPITGGMSLPDYIRLVRSMKARFRAGVARNPAERAAVNWALVLADAQAGITKDMVFNLNNSAGWDYWWLNQMAVGKGWSQMTPYYIGMADTSSGYASWLALDRNSRQPFLILTPDKRFPSGETRAAQNASSPSTAAQLPSVYFRNRPSGEDTPGEAWANSFYDFTRFYQYRAGSSIGPWVWYSLAENNLLAAEALIRLNRPAEAVPYVNTTRVANGLAPFPAGSTEATRAPVQPGGSATDCVPRTPTAAGNALECGTLFEAVKYEKRLETLFTGYNAWFTEERGWGDLPAGSTQMWPVPYQEMDARRETYYNSVTGAQWIAASNTYGFGVGNK